MQRFLCVLAILCLCCNANGQSAAALKTGATLPNIFFHDVINAPISTASLFSFKKKLVLLNFWATNCGACAGEMPVLDSLQRAYPNDLSVIMVTSSKADTREKVLKFLTRLQVNNGRAIQLPVIWNDSLLNQYFPHAYVPYYAWLDSDLKVIAVTGPEEASPESIVSYMRGEKNSFLQKEDMTGFDVTAPLFINGNGGSGRTLRMRSTLCDYIPGMPPVTHVNTNSDGKVTGLLLTNLPILSLLRFAYNFNGVDSLIRYDRGKADTLSLKGKTQEWIAAHSYTYELITPPVSKAIALEYMREDLRRFFGYEVTVKKIPRRCLVLTVNHSTLQQFTCRGGEKTNPFSNPSRPLFHNRSVEALANMLEQQLRLPVINASGFTSKIDIDLSGINLQNMGSVKAVFAKFGIILTETEKAFEELFITHLPN